MKTIIGTFLTLAGFLSWELAAIHFLAEYQQFIHFIQVVVIFNGSKMILEADRPRVSKKEVASIPASAPVNNLTYRTEVLRAAHRERRDSSKKAA